MAINDLFMLPRRVRTMEQMADLLRTEQVELTQSSRTIKALENQLSISTSTFLLSRHERIFSVVPNSQEPLELRRSRLIAKLRGQGAVTADRLRAVAASFAPLAEAVIVEHCSEYRFEIWLNQLDVIPPIDAICTSVEELKPAHISFSLGLGIRTSEASVAVLAAPLVGCALMVGPYTAPKLKGTAKLAAAIYPGYGVSILIKPDERRKQNA